MPVKGGSPAQNQPLVLKFPSGIDNRNREYEIAEGSARVLDNVDVTRSGGLRCRDGMRQVWSSSCHSLFAHPRGIYLLLVRDGVLGRMDRTETWTALTSVGGAVVYALLDDAVYWSDGAASGRVAADGSLGAWGLATPSFPTPSAVSGSGGLLAGTYQVTMTAVHPTGLESGAGEPVAVTLTEVGAILVSAPAASSYTFNVYATGRYGESHELRHVATLAGGGAATITDLSGGKRLDSLLAVKPLPAQCLCAHKGRLWAASGTVVWFTSEKSTHWLFPASGYYAFESTVTMLGAAEDGVYVGLADRVYYLQGNNPMEMTRRLVATTGAVFGGGYDIPVDLFPGQSGFPSRQCAWWDQNGVLSIGKPGGIIARPTTDRYAAGFAESGYIGYRAVYGTRQLVSVLNSTDTIAGGWRAADVAVSEVFAQGVAL